MRARWQNKKKTLPPEWRKGGGENVTVPKNSSSKIDDQQNASRFREKSTTPQLDKMASRPSSLNKINKNLP